VSGGALLEMAKDVVYAPIVGESLVDLTPVSGFEQLKMAGTAPHRPKYSPADE